MAIKWKNNSESKSGSIIRSLVAIASITILFFVLMPSFKNNAEVEIPDPLSTGEFAEILYKSNHIQYKYLKERSDQRQYSFRDLYYDLEPVELSDKEKEEMKQSYDINGYDALYSYYENDNDFEQDLFADFDSAMLEWEELQYLLSVNMDYYAVDQSTGVSMTNSNNKILKEIATDQSSLSALNAYDDYVYYVCMNFDSAGYLNDAYAYSNFGNSSDFIKILNSLSHDDFFDRYGLADNSKVLVSVESVQSDGPEPDQEFFVYQVNRKPMADMTIVYAADMDAYQQLSAILAERGYFDSQIFRSDYSNYAASGYFAFFYLLCFLSAGSGLLFSFLDEKKNRSKGFASMKICSFPLEINAVVFFLFFVYLSLSDGATDFLISLQEETNLFGLSRVLNSLGLDLIYILLSMLETTLIFLTAYLLGATLCGIWHPKEYFKNRSLICKYWDKILTYLKDFYKELVSFDIGKKADKMIRKLVIINFVILFIISLFWIWGIIPLAIYSILIYFLLKKYVKEIQDKYQNLLKATSAIAKGDLDVVLTEDFGVFESYKSELRQIQTDFKKAIDEEVRSTRMKSELITNVSHDLKTPLTAIITYIELLKDPKITDIQRSEYISTLDKKAMRLKVLIEDLFEVSKASTDNIVLNLVQMDICSLLRQCYMEYEDKIEAAGLIFRFQLPEDKLFLNLDSQKTFRIFENLYTNIVKYALENTRVYISVTDNEDRAVIELKNISKNELQMSPNELTERFVRGDSSRNTEGSGLGLAIAKSFTEAQGGSFKLDSDGDLFKVRLEFKKTGNV